MCCDASLTGSELHILGVSWEEQRCEQASSSVLRQRMLVCSRTQPGGATACWRQGNQAASAPVPQTFREQTLRQGSGCGGQYSGLYIITRQQPSSPSDSFSLTFTVQQTYSDRAGPPSILPPPLISLYNTKSRTNSNQQPTAMAQQPTPTNTSQRHKPPTASSTSFSSSNATTLKDPDSDSTSSTTTTTTAATTPMSASTVSTLPQQPGGQDPAHPEPGNQGSGDERASTPPYTAEEAARYARMGASLVAWPWSEGEVWRDPLG